MEEGMPDVVSANTAKEIDERIQRHKKVLVLVTENSKDCRWAPWELSHAGLAKGMEHIAAFPVAGNCDFSQCEYLKIYPKIYFVGNTWYVWQDDPVKITELAAWLRS